MIPINQINNSYSRKRGITLCETMVIILCLTAVVPILLAAMPEFNRPNREAMCAYRLGRIGSAMIQYTIENELYLPGSPGTSGAQLIFDYPEASYDETNMPTDVTETWDWAGPLATYFNMSLDPDRAVRTKQLRKGHFWCPSNNYVSTPYTYAGDPPPPWGNTRMISYNTMRDMLYYGDNARLDPALENHARYVSGWNTAIPETYEPKIINVGNPSQKAFLADGSRFTWINEGNLELLYYVDFKAQYGGSFSSNTPTAYEDYLRSFLLDPSAMEISYRHKHGEIPGINVVHFDGHVEWVSEPDTRHPDRWYPTGTLIPPNEMNTPSKNSLPRDAFTGPGNTYQVN